jgi:hypothetical protein
MDDQEDRHPALVERRLTRPARHRQRGLRRDQGEMEAGYFWGLLAQQRYPSREGSAPADSRLAWAWTRGVMDVLAWTCGEASEGPLSGRRVPGRPTLHEVSLDACRAMTGVRMAREANEPVRARRMEAVMETFLWLAGWTGLPPVDRHGHGTFETCPEREVPGDEIVHS